MKRKIVVILVLLAIVILIKPSIEAINETSIEEDSVISNNMLLPDMFVKIDSIEGESEISVGLKITITNLGEYMKQNVEWTFNADGENIRFGDGITGRIPVLDSGQEFDIILRPAHFLLNNADGQSPIGFGSVNLMATARTSTDTAETTENTFIIGPFLLFIYD